MNEADVYHVINKMYFIMDRLESHSPSTHAFSRAVCLELMSNLFGSNSANTVRRAAMSQTINILFPLDG